MMKTAYLSCSLAAFFCACSVVVIGAPSPDIAAIKQGIHEANEGKRIGFDDKDYQVLIALKKSIETGNAQEAQRQLDLFESRIKLDQYLKNSSDDTLRRRVNSAPLALQWVLGRTAAAFEKLPDNAPITQALPRLIERYSMIVTRMTKPLEDLDLMNYVLRKTKKARAVSDFTTLNTLEGIGTAVSAIEDLDQKLRDERVIANAAAKKAVDNAAVLVKGQFDQRIVQLKDTIAHLDANEYIQGLREAGKSPQEIAQGKRALLQEVDYGIEYVKQDTKISNTHVANTMKELQRLIEQELKKVK